MKKLEEIDRLVEEAMTELLEAPLASTQKRILTSLARKCAEINLEDFCLIRKYTVGDYIEAYNSRLRDGQVEEVKQECDLPPNERFFIDERGGCIAVRDKQHPKYDHTYPGLHETTPDVIFYGHGYRENGDGNWMISELTRKKANEVLAHLISMHTPSQPALQPLPEKAPEWFIPTGRENYRVDTWKKVIQHFGTQPREWWMDLKKGDKFLFENNKVKEFNGFVELGDYIWLGSIDNPKTSYRADYCSPYTDPAQSFRSKLTPEMQVEFDKVIETINKKNESN